MLTSFRSPVERQRTVVLVGAGYRYRAVGVVYYVDGNPGARQLTSAARQAGPTRGTRTCRRALTSFALLTIGLLPIRAGAATPHVTLRTFRLVGYIAPTRFLAQGLDPPYAADAADRWIVNMVDQNLVTLDDHGRIVKGLASKITVSPDRKRYVFTLRRASFANGDPITAQDVAYSIKRVVRAPGSQLSYYDEAGYADIRGADAYADPRSADLTGIKVLSRSQLEIDVTKPIAAFLTILASGPNEVLDPAVVRRSPTQLDNNFLTNSCPAARDTASGQFTFHCHGNAFYPASEAPHYTLVPNPRYTGPLGRARIHVVIQSAKTVADAQAMFRSGKTDAVSGVVPRAANGRLLRWSGSAVWWLALNTVDPPFNNLHCRLALANSLDRTPFVKGLNDTLSTRRIVPPGILLGYSTRHDPSRNPTRSRAELAQCPGASQDIGVEITPQMTPGALVDSLHSAGFPHITPHLCMNWYFCDPYGNTLHQLGFGATMMSWDMDYPDPGDYLSTALSPTSHVNTGGYQDPTFDTLIARATTDPDAAERVRLYRQAEHRLLAQAAVIPLRISRPEWTISRAVSGLTGRAPTGPIPVPPGADWSRLRVP